MRQRDAFVAGEGDAFYRRNARVEGALAERWTHDPVLRALERVRARPDHALEVGAGDGWRLGGLRARHPGARVVGLEPSAEAVRAGRRRFGLALVRGTAERLPFPADAFDLVILGFCLYLCDRSDLFRIAAEVDRVAREGSLVVVFDFHPPVPHRNAYAHLPGQFSYKMDYTAMFLWNPAYRLLHRDVVGHGGRPASEPDERLAVGVLRRREADAYREGPLAGGGVAAGAPLGERAP